jgi:hypothetical protein
MYPCLTQRAVAVAFLELVFAGERRQFVGVAGSVFLHATVVALTMLTFAHGHAFVEQPALTVPIDLVRLSDETNVTASVRPAPKVDTEVKDAPSPPNPTQSPTPTLSPDNTLTPPPQDQSATEPVLSSPPPAPTPLARPSDNPKSAIEKTDLHAASALAKDVAPTPTRTNVPVANRTVQGVGDQSSMTADLQNILLNMIRPCWSAPAGVPHPEDLIVDLDVFLNPDGSVARPPTLRTLQADSSNSPFRRAAAEAALRAIYSCAPFRLPADRYSQWREIRDFRFDGRQIMGN